MKKVSFVCTGNICRSPMGEVVLRALVEQSPVLAGHAAVSSAGTANWDVGQPMDQRAAAALKRAGFFGDGPVAQFASRDYLDRQDLVVVMTREHRSDVLARRTRDGEVILLRSLLDDGLDLDLADPYYGDDATFDLCLDTIIRSCRELVRGRLLEGATFEA